MRISLTAFDLSAPDGQERFIEVNASLEEISAAELGDPNYRVTGKLTVKYRDAAILIDGVVETDLDLACDRCLTAIKQRVKGQVEALVVEEGVELPEVDTFILPRTLDGAGIDLAPALKEALLVEVPQKLLCREDCKGLCPACGTDLNIELCNCSPRNVDERWGPLLDIKRKLEQA